MAPILIRLLKVILIVVSERMHVPRRNNLTCRGGRRTLAGSCCGLAKFLPYIQTRGPRGHARSGHRCHPSANSVGAHRHFIEAPSARRAERRHTKRSAAAAAAAAAQQQQPTFAQVSLSEKGGGGLGGGTLPHGEHVNADAQPGPALLRGSARVLLSLQRWTRHGGEASHGKRHKHAARSASDVSAHRMERELASGRSPPRSPRTPSLGPVGELQSPVSRL